MNTPISNTLRITFLIHIVVALVFGSALWLIPGRSLTWLGVVPEQVQLPQSELSVPGTSFVDPVITRLLGSALLALGYASFLGWRASKRDQVLPLVQMELIFCVFGAVATLINIFRNQPNSPMIGSVLIAVILFAFAAAWGLALLRKSDIKV
jgi:hypothetical protein